MIEVEIQDFQAIDKLKIRIDGFTAIVGQTNVGKSSIIRALECALTGAEGTSFVRHNLNSCARVLRGVKECACKASVHLTFAEGHKLLWEKGDTINQYTAWSVEGVKTVYSSVGRGTDAPAMLAEGFDLVKVGQKRTLLQVADQWDPLFLVNSSGTVVADVLSDVAQLDNINEAMRAVSKDRRSAAATRKVRDSDIKVTQERLKKYQGLDAVTSKARRVQHAYLDLSVKTQVVDQVSKFISDYIRIGLALRALQEATKHLLPEADPLSTSSTRYKSASRLSKALEVGVQGVRALSGVADVDVPDISELNILSGSTSQAVRFYVRLSAGERLGSALEGVTRVVVPSLSALQASLGAFKEVSSWQARFVQLKTILDKYRLVSEIDVEGLDLEQLRAKGVRAQRAADLYIRLSSLEKAVRVTEDELALAISEESNVVSEFADLGRCPTCTQDITPHHGGHS